MDIDELPTETTSDLKMQVAKLEESFGQVRMQSGQVERDLAKQFDSMAKFDKEFKSAMILLQQRHPPDLGPQLDKLQSSILKAIEGHDHLHTEVAELCQQLAPMGDRMATLLSKLGKSGFEM